jgi:hypothetical protein
MSVTVTDMAFEPRSISQGPKKFQFVTVQALSGATSGTVTADRLNVIEHIVLPGIKSHTAAPTFSGNVATLAFTVPAETAASRTIDGVLYTAVANLGAGGNSVTIQIVDGTGDVPAVTKGNETVAVSGTAIVVHIDPTAVTGSARNDVKAAVIASAAASALVTPSTVTSGTTVAAVTAATALQNGVTGGYIGNAICIGR